MQTSFPERFGSFSKAGQFMDVVTTRPQDEHGMPVSVCQPMLTSFGRRQSGRPPEWLAAARAKHTHRVGTTTAPKYPRTTRQSLNNPASQRSRDPGGNRNSSRPTPLDSTRLTGSGCASYSGRNVSHHCRRHTHKFFRRRSTRGLTSDASRVSDSRKYS